jgi:fatty acid desaturase
VKLELRGVETVSSGENRPREKRPGYRDWRSGLVSIALVVLLGVTFLYLPDFGPYAVVLVVAAFLGWRFISAKRDG